jgi:hypothetical protein
MWEFPTGSPGQSLDVLWQAAKRAVRSCRLLQGYGILLTRTGDGTIISANVAQPPPPTAFLCSLNQTQASILPGLVNGEMPLLSNAYLDGTSQDGHTQVTAPTLDLGDSPALDPTGRGYIALQFTCDDKWALIPATLTVVQCAWYDSLDGTTYPDGGGGPATLGGVPGLPGRKVRYPLAMIRQRTNQQLVLTQNVTGSLNHKADPRGDDVARHFFWPTGPSGGAIAAPSSTSTSTSSG